MRAPFIAQSLSRKNFFAGLLLASLFSSAGCSSLARWRTTLVRAQPTHDSKTAEEVRSSALPNDIGSGRDRQVAINLETAELAVERGMDEQAIANYLNVRKLDPGNAKVAYPLAVLYDRAGRVDDAESEYQLALRHNPKDKDCLCDYGYFLYSTGRLQDAETRLREALRLSPDHRQAQINLAMVLGSQAKYDEAHALFQTALGPASADHNIGMLKLRAGDREGASQYLQAAAARDPSLLRTRSVLKTLDPQANNGPPIAQVR